MSLIVLQKFTRVARVFSDHDLVRLVVERAHPVVVGRLCLCLRDEHGHVYKPPLSIFKFGL